MAEAANEQPQQELGSEVATSLTSTSASSSNSDLPCTAPAEGERPSGGRRHGNKSFTGLRLFGRSGPFAIVVVAVNNVEVKIKMNQTGSVEHVNMQAPQLKLGSNDGLV
ncbi:hypothetical protein MHYP_G00299020 [Metynnis hypsauchen]